MKKLYKFFTISLFLLFLTQSYNSQAKEIITEVLSANAIQLEIAPGIHCNYSSGKYTVNTGDNLFLTFGPDNHAKTVEDILFLIDGKETSFKDLGGNYDFTYNLSKIEADHSIVIALKTYPVTIPETEGTYLTPLAGIHEVTYGEKFWLEISIKSGYDYTDLKVYANDEELELFPLPEKCFTKSSLLSGLPHYYNGCMLEAVKGPVNIRIEGLKKEEPGFNNRDAEVEVINENLVSISFPAPESVFSYILKIYELTTTEYKLVRIDNVKPDSSNGLIRSDIEIHSFYVDGLEPDKIYMIEVEAFDYNEQNELALIGSITITFLTHDNTVDNTSMNNDYTHIIYSAEGMLYVETKVPEFVKVYSLNGVLKSAQQINGTVNIPLAKGLYIVNVGSKVYKVAVN